MTTLDEHFRGLYNVSGFDGTVASDFAKLGIIPDNKKADLIDYSLEDFEEHRTAFRDYLKAVYPLDYTNFATSDLGQMILELLAYMASTNSLKADMIANEMYLPTVKDRGNLGKLLKLIGVSMKGPTASKATGVVKTSGEDFTGETHIVLSQSDRSMTVSNSRDTGSLIYTLYKQNTNGSIALDGGSVELSIADSDAADGAQWSNLILLEGALSTKTGQFSPGQTIQKVKLNSASIIEGSISVSSDEGGGTIYNEISNLYLASGSTQAVFEKEYDSNYDAVLTFGDGVKGSLPAPNASYIATFRIGGGARGNVARGAINNTLNVLGKATSNQYVATVENTTMGTGGFDAETNEHAKRYAPYFFRTQYRAVTGEDYATLASIFVGSTGQTAKAIAAVRKNGSSANMIDVYVLSKASDLQLERSSIAFKNELLNHYNRYKMLTDEITIVDGVIRTVDLVATVFIDKHRERYEEQIKQKVAAELQKYFNVDRREFGQKLSISDLQNFILQVPEVRFFNTDNLDKDVFVSFNEVIQLNNFELNVELV
jgi:hypothetical protein